MQYSLQQTNQDQCPRTKLILSLKYNALKVFYQTRYVFTLCPPSCRMRGNNVGCARFGGQKYGQQQDSVEPGTTSSLKKPNVLAWMMVKNPISFVKTSRAQWQQYRACNHWVSTKMFMNWRFWQLYVHMDSWKIFMYKQNQLLIDVFVGAS
jgi:hypothetical protein